MKRPVIPMCSDISDGWVYDGKLYKEGVQADHLYHTAMISYADFLSERLTRVEGLIKMWRDYAHRANVSANFYHHTDNAFCIMRSESLRAELCADDLEQELRS